MICNTGHSPISRSITVIKIKLMHEKAENKLKLVLKKKLAPSNENFLAIENTTLIPANIIIWPELRTSRSIRVKTRVKEIYEPTQRLSHAGHESLVPTRFKSRVRSN